ncbi:GntR family transcriptional regulator [Sinomonas cellulolyticus]|uniref:GntR family transcriptional regulator n=1 Tax=Sinomonas cellulolyticus TaxID=2801916 RepID=A0ABS1JZ95_9MICC|nr:MULTISPECIES: GntR family transcriptional regulator [Sinomonas]MBL0704447.1 GntR family transcriptional regulator [Sinomonas cellulolyticus]GHG48731.1 GntR family transcriptional regulator [Sinomonas sp. KCTC 49339]
MSFGPPALQPAHSAADLAHGALAARIISGSLAPGAVLTEGSQSAELAMSRTPVHKAFLRLAAEGLLRLRPHQGAVVTAEDARTTHELLEARIMLESESVRACAASGSEAAAAADLDPLLSAQAQALRRGDALGFAAADHAFHARIAAASGNALVEAFYGQIRPRLERITRAVVLSGQADLARFLSDHRRLVTFLERADAARYAVLLRAHVGFDGPKPSGS